MALRLKFIGAPEWKSHYKFHPKRKWEFDFAWPELKIAVEVEGGTWKFGRHNRPEGYEKDCEKYNAAIEEGWKVFRFTGRMIETTASGQMERVFKELHPKPFEWQQYGWFMYEGKNHRFRGTAKECIDMLVANGVPREVAEKEFKQED